LAQVAGVSVEVLDAATRARRLTETKHAYLTRLVNTTRRHSGRPSLRIHQLRPAVQRLLDSTTDVPACAWTSWAGTGRPLRSRPDGRPSRFASPRLLTGWARTRRT
jgi:hypothetical protein